MSLPKKFVQGHDVSGPFVTLPYHTSFFQVHELTYKIRLSIDIISGL